MTVLKFIVISVIALFGIKTIKGIYEELKEESQADPVGSGFDGLTKSIFEDFGMDDNGL